jgi:H+/Cl- antiporter ClcA
MRPPSPSNAGRAPLPALNRRRGPADALGVEILGSVITVLGWIALIWLRFYWWHADQIRREQREEPFGSKRWHWPAFAFLGFLVIVSVWLLRFAEDPR